MNLQTALIALGILLVAAIYLFSRWQERRGGNAESRTRRARSEMSEPSLGRDEPSFDERITGDLDADLNGAQSSGTEEPAPPPDWDALEREMARPRESDREFDRESDPDWVSATPPAENEDASVPAGEEIPDAADADAGAQYQPDKAVAQATGEPSHETPEDNLAEAAESADGAAKLDDDIPVLELRVDESDAGSTAETDQQADEKTLERPVAMADDESPAPQPGAADAPQNEPLTTEPADNEAPMDNGESEMPADDGDLDMRDERPSLGSFLGSLKPINKLRHSIQSRLDAVKAEREESTVDAIHNPDDAAAISGPDKPGQVDLLDLSPPPESAEESDHRDGSPATEETKDSRVQSAGGEKSDARDRSRQSPTLGDANQESDLLPAPGFDKLSQIDYYVKLSGERDASRDSVLAVYREAAAGLSKSHSVYGLRLPDKVWRDLEHEPEESRFGDLVITVQLADNTGPVSEQEMTRFSNLVVKLSESTGRGFSFMAPIENAHQQALAIDRLRRKFDSIFVVNIKPTEDEYFDGAMIDRCASQIGLTPDDNKFYARYKPVGKQKVCLYSMANMTDNGEFEIGNMRGTRTRGVTFFTRPAVNRSPGAVFSEMVDAAKAFASRVKGEPIAPGYDDLSNDDIEAIRRSIEKVAREMESYGIVPGSEEASRLF